MADGAEDMSGFFTKHAVGMATALRRQGNLAGAEHMLQQAVSHFVYEDCDYCYLALEQARHLRDIGQIKAASAQLLELYDYVVQCDSNTQLVAIEIALEVAWGLVLAQKWAEAQQWFTKACLRIDSLPAGSCTLLAAVSHSGLAAVQMYAYPDSTTAKSILSAEAWLKDFPHQSADGCQTAYLYLAICSALQGCASKAQQHHASAMQALSAVYAPHHLYATACQRAYEHACSDAALG